MDWLDLLAVQGTLKSLIQHYRSKASLFQCSAFFTVQLSHPYMTTGKTIALTRQTFVGKVMSLLFFFFMYSPSRSTLPPPSVPDPSGSSQCTSLSLLSYTFHKKSRKKCSQVVCHFITKITFPQVVNNNSHFPSRL